MKTVLHLIETGGTGGAETVYLNLIRGLDPSRWRSVAVVPYRGWVSDRLAEDGIEPVVLNDRRAFDPVFLARMLALVRRRRVDLIQAHLFGSAVRAGLLSRVCGIPAVGTLHGEIDFRPTERYRRLKVGLANRLRRMVFVSDPLRRSFLTAAPFRPEITAVIPNGIDTQRFAPRSDPAFRAELGIAPDEFVVGAVGNLCEAKGYDVLLRAAAILKARGQELRFVVLGEGKENVLQELVALRDSLGLARDVLFTGFRGDADRAMAAFDVYVLTSRSEGFSLSVVEAMATELPVVATRCGGPEEVLEDGVTGLLVENGSAEEVADRIEALRADPGERRRLGRAARSVARARFAVEAQVQAYDRLYEECLRPAGRPAPVHAHAEIG